MKSEEVKSKNPERFRIQDFLAPPAGLAKQKGAGGTFLQAVSATRTGAKRNQATYSPAAGVARGKFASQSLHLFLPLVGAACCYASNPTEKKTKSRPPIGDLLFVGVTGQNYNFYFTLCLLFVSPGDSPVTCR